VKLGLGVQARAEWRSRLERFCNTFNIPFEEPQWLLLG
jgi:hypothetical protein